MQFVEIQVIKSVTGLPMPQDPEFYDLRQWLTPIYGGEYYRDEYKHADRLRAEGTCLWLKEEKAYCSWQESFDSSRFLWIFGSPGSGKTILVSSIIKDLQRTFSESGSNTQVLYFFCNSRGNDQHKSTPLAVIRSLLFQLWELTWEDPAIGRVWREICHKFNPDKFSYRPNYVSAMRMVLDHLVTVYIVIDGLDECEQRSGLVADILELLKDAERGMLKTQLKVLIASRQEHDLSRAFAKMPRVELTSQKTEADVNRMIKACVDTAVKAGARWLEQKPIKSKVVRALKHRAKGMYSFLIHSVLMIGSCGYGCFSMKLNECRATPRTK